MTPETETIARYESLRVRLSEILSLADQVDEELIALEGQLPDGYLCPDDPLSQGRSVVTINVGTLLEGHARRRAKSLRADDARNYRPPNIRC